MPLVQFKFRSRCGPARQKAVLAGVAERGGGQPRRAFPKLPAELRLARIFECDAIQNSTAQSLVTWLSAQIGVEYAEIAPEYKLVD